MLGHRTTGIGTNVRGNLGDYIARNDRLRHQTMHAGLDPANVATISYLNIWDAGWYRGIYKEWYPTELPLRADGSVSFNSWAFFMPPLMECISHGE